MKTSENRFILLQERISNELQISKYESKVQVFNFFKKIIKNIIMMLNIYLFKKNLVNLYHEYLREKNNYKSSIKTFVPQRNDMINKIIRNIMVII